MEAPHTYWNQPVVIVFYQLRVCLLPCLPSARNPLRSQNLAHSPNFDPARSLHNAHDIPVPIIQPYFPSDRPAHAFP